MSSDIKVSVCVVTYNQEKYIAECLQSLVDQVTDFPFEIIVGEDCSTDRTREIVLEFQKKYPDIIKPLLHVKNVGPVENVLATYKQAKGKYIAHMDGDDYALPNKLQLQADVLDNNPDCIICSHNMNLLTFNGEKLNKTFKIHSKVKNDIFDLYETLPFFAHSSKMFVNDLDKSYWNELHPQALDIEVHVRQAKNGNIYHLNEPLGIYRIGLGVSSQEKNKINPLIPAGNERVFKSALREYKDKNRLMKKLYAKSLLNYAYQSAVLGDKVGLVKYLKKSLAIKVFSVRQVFMSVFFVCPSLFLFLARIRASFRYR